MNEDDQATGALVTNHGGEPCLRTVRVVVDAGPDRGRTWELARGTLVIGKGADADARLADETVSRRHVELALLADGVRVRDLASKNGTFLGDGGARVESVIVAPPARVKVGSTTLSIVAEDAPVAMAESPRFGKLTTRSARMGQLFSLLARAAKSDATLLLEGETGVGKDVLARTVHDESGRKGPFVVFDCGSVAATMAAAELFGHKRGAFTGATADRAGPFEAARGGTVFLDEIGELPAELQPMLLRVLENREVRRVGESVPRPVDVRVIAATNRALLVEADAGRFRKDLYFRLAVVRAAIPPLRERLEDVPVLAAAVLAELGRPPLSPTDVARLVRRSWPGNVRELKNLLVRSAALAGDSFAIVEDDAPDDRDDEQTRTAPGGGSFFAQKRGVVGEFERGYVVALLERNDWNVSAAAREAGVDRKQIQRLMARYAISRPSS